MKEFFTQGGYGFFIWMSFGLTAVLLIAEILVLRHRRRQLLRRIRLQSQYSS